MSQPLNQGRPLSILLAPDTPLPSSGTNPRLRPVITCEIPHCGKTKQDSNHWLMAKLTITMTGIRIDEWDQHKFVNDPDVMPLCGDLCAHKLLSKFLTDLKTKSDERSK